MKLEKKRRSQAEPQGDRFLLALRVVKEKL